MFSAMTKKPITVNAIDPYFSGSNGGPGVPGTVISAN
jgi:hypothetical protein